MPDVDSKQGSFDPTALPLVGVGTVVCAISLMYSIGIEWLGGASFGFLNQIGPAILALACITGGYLSIKKYPLTIWSPIPWFLLSSAGFYGLGPLTYHFATSETVSYLDSLYLLDEKSLLRTNLLNGVGIATVSLALAMTILIAPGSIARKRPYHRALTKKLMWTFIAVAAPVKYLFVMPHIMGKLSYVLPGAIQYLSEFMGTAIILVFILVTRGEKKYVPLLAILILSEFAFGLLALSKTAIIQTALLTCLGFWLQRQSMVGLTTAGLAIITVYMLILSPFVTFARTIIGTSSMKETTDINIAMDAYESVGPNELGVLSPEVQGWWARLSYANVQSFAMERFDEGNRGHTFDLLPYVFVPRLISPDKPLMTSGIEFSQLIIGPEENTHTGLGIFAEAYWNGGWPLVLLTCTYVGLILAVLSIFAMRTMSDHDYVYIPIVLLGIQMALTGSTDWFVPTFAGGLVEALVWFIIFYLLKDLFKQNAIPRPIHLPR